MSKLTEWSFRNKAAVSLLVIMALVMGALSYFKLPMEFLPEADNPQIAVTTIAMGSDAKSMEQEVTVPLESALELVKGKTVMLSSSGDGYSQINLNFDSKTDMKEAKAEVERIVAGVSLPANVMKPFVVHYTTSMIPISWVMLSFDAGMNEAQKEAAYKEVFAALQKTEGAGQVTSSGSSAPIVSITPLHDRLQAAGLTSQHLMGVLQGRGVSASIGEWTLDGTAGNIGVVERITDIGQLRALPVAPGIALQDVAEVELTVDQSSVTTYNGKDAVMITIAKSGDANAVKVGEAVDETVKSLNETVQGVEAAVLLSTAESIVTSVNSMMREVLLGALFATIVILLFMRNFKATLVTIVSIPLSLGITLYLLDISGVSLNIITLGGVAVAVGRLVDDSIVVIENIYRRLQKEAFSIGLITDATKEVASAITSSTLVTVAVFLPMGMLRGSLQAFLLPFALTVAYSLLASLVVALTVVPLLSALLLKGTAEKEHSGSPKFKSFIGWNLKHKWVALSVAFILLIGSVSAYVMMPKGALDTSSSENVQISLAYPAGTPSEAVISAGKRLEAFIMEDEAVDWVIMTAGNSADSAKAGSVASPTEVSYIVDLKEGANADTFMANVKGQAASYENAELLANAVDLMMGGGSSQIYVDVLSENPDELAEGANRLVAAIGQIDGVSKVESSEHEKKAVYTFNVDPSKARGQDIAMSLSSLLNPMPIGSITLEGKDTPVMLQPDTAPESMEELKGLTVITSQGPVQIGEIAELVRTEQPSLYYHKDGKSYVRVTATVDPNRLSVIGNDIRAEVNKLEKPEGVTLAVGGASADMSEDFADLGMTALVSIGIVYLIMVLAFRTLRAPLAIMISLPLAAIGAVGGLLVSGVTPDFTAMFGALMLIGIVVTNAIVLIDRVKQNERTMSIRDSLIEAAATRMRPIVMTALATICAMLPLVFGTHSSSSIVSQSLAIVVIGGLAAATLLTLIVVPCMYELLFFRKSRMQRKLGATADAEKSVNEAAAAMN